VALTYSIGKDKDKVAKANAVLPCSSFVNPIKISTDELRDILSVTSTSPSKPNDLACIAAVSATYVDFIFYVFMFFFFFFFFSHNF